MPDEPKLHLWEISGSEPQIQDGRTYSSNLHRGVCAWSFDEAIAAFRMHHPVAIIHSVEKRSYLGRQGLIIHPDVIEVMKGVDE